ncbi:MAG: HisA/HisF-related TIM barrel protein, partial [Gammaproteobacteria bacterium]
AARDPDEVGGWITRYGADAVVVALDVRIDADGMPRPATDGWKRAGDADLWELLDVYAGTGLMHLLCTDIGRDGTGVGPNVALYSEILRRYPRYMLQASGGVASTVDLDTLRACGVPAVVCGRALLHGDIDAVEAFA